MVLVHREASDPSQMDRLSRGRFFERMADLLIDEKTLVSTGWVVGLTGPWGSGKTKALFAVRDALEKRLTNSPNPVLILNFNPWLHSGRNELIQSLFDLLRTTAEASKQRYPELKHVTSVLHKHRKNIGRVTALSNIFFKGSGQLVQTFTEHPLEEQRADILSGLEKAKASAIVLIDEIDRLSDEEIRSIAQMVKSVADFPMFSYLLAYDPVRVATALGGVDNVKLGHAYLEKIVQVQMRLPRADPGDLIGMALEDVYRILKFYDQTPGTQRAEPLPSEAKLREVLRFLIPEILSTPRDIRRLVAAFEARLPLAGIEIGIFDLLRYCALESRVPILSDRLQTRTQRVSVDGFRELQRLPAGIEDSQSCIRWVLGEFQDEPSLRDLLLYLFPALREGASEAITRDDRRLCYETPLLALLNGGPLPGMITTDGMEKLLADPEGQLPIIFDEATENGRLRHAVLRLRTTLAKRSLEMDRIERIWTAAAHYFDRSFDPTDKADWQDWLELTHVLVRGAMRRFLAKGHHPITAEFTKELIEGGCVHLPATILFFQAQAHGLIVRRDSSLISSLIDKDTTGALLALAAKAFQKRIETSEAWLLRSAHPLWIIYMASQGSEGFRQHLSNPNTTAQLYGTILLLMRTNVDILQPENGDNLRLAELLDMPTLLEYWRRSLLDDPDLSSPITEANAFMIRQSRRLKQPSA